jgi:hypothetical protein
LPIQHEYAVTLGVKAIAPAAAQELQEPRPMFTARSYNPAIDERLLALAAEGLSRAEIAVELGVSLADFDAWSASEPGFAALLADADTRSQAWWQRQAGAAMAGGQAIRVSLWAKVMAQRYGRTTHSSRPKADAAKPPPVRARYELPDNGTSRRGKGKGG